jgi:mannose/cellobiose epimerase-like protein (N-acyl-D-glucosamine 2-epimerase family)
VDALRDRAEAARSWLFDQALPLWWERGYDCRARCFHEGLNQTGAPIAAPRRIRNQARQTFAFARAGLLGWNGPWREAVEAGVVVLMERGLRADGGTRHALDAHGEMSDDRRDLYDLSCVLLGLAEASRALSRPDLLSAAEELAQWCEQHWAHPAGGYQEGEITEPGLRRQNPHMHLLEAFLALYEASGSAIYLERANRLATLAADKMIQRGALLEYFDDAWSPQSGDRGDVVEPGHEFEWAWLFARLRTLGGRDLSAAADAVRTHAETHGVDHAKRLVLDEIKIDGSVRANASRIWPHAERLRAHLAHFEQTSDSAAAQRAADAFDALWTYRSVDVPGLWRDRKDANGAWLDATAPASGLYHLVGAFSELFRVSVGNAASR